MHKPQAEIPIPVPKTDTKIVLNKKGSSFLLYLRLADQIIPVLSDRHTLRNCTIPMDRNTRPIMVNATVTPIVGTMLTVDA